MLRLIQMLNEDYDDSQPEYVPSPKVLSGLVFYLTNMAYPQHGDASEGQAYDKIANFMRNHPEYLPMPEDLEATVRRLGFEGHEAIERSQVLAGKYRDYHPQIIRY